MAFDRSQRRDTFFVLRRKPLGERDDILVCLGRDSGVFSAVVKGSRGGKSRLSGLLEPPVELEAVLRSGSGTLDSLSQPQLRRSFSALRRNLDGLLTAGFLGRLFTAGLPEHSPVEGIYDLFGFLLEALAGEGKPASVGLLAQDRLLLELGLACDWETCQSCGLARLDFFSPRDGGPVCHDCYAGHGPAIEPTVLAGLRRLRATSLDGGLPIFEPEVVRGMGRLLKLQLQQHLELSERVFRPVLPRPR